MQTQLLNASPASISVAAKALQQGALVAIPTETVYGLAADATNAKAVENIFQAKGRPQDNPLICHISTLEMLSLLTDDVPAALVRLADAFWPGPLTVVVPCKSTVPTQVTAGLGTVGIRMPSHPVALQIIQEADVPLAAPSANRSGSPSPTLASHVMQDMQGKIPYVLDGGPCTVGVESTVLSLSPAPVILRPGYITQVQLEKALQQPVAIAAAVSAPLQKGAKAESPGMKYRHYAPKAQVFIIEGSRESYVHYLQQHTAPNTLALCFEEDAPFIPVPFVTYGRQADEASQAAALFTALRQCDDANAEIVYARMPQKSGIGLAVYNRLLRAATFRVITL